ncbi:hypothetical protein B0J11DRAFT_211171 [Dendryphion nanum]|uniref:Uncharacterized protein n=1 Tax=Dendryphion nanum TaxID=256645 RepID=A0A9P9E790_9PLEO|nr:hypothetical protein B0J11DRAFT_211171 [Dendryphion nanum]
MPRDEPDRLLSLCCSWRFRVHVDDRSHGLEEAVDPMDNPLFWTHPVANFGDRRCIPHRIAISFYSIPHGCVKGFVQKDAPRQSMMGTTKSHIFDSGHHPAFRTVSQPYQHCQIYQHSTSPGKAHDSSGMLSPAASSTFGGTQSPRDSAPQYSRLPASVSPKPHVYVLGVSWTRGPPIHSNWSEEIDDNLHSKADDMSSISEYVCRMGFPL